MVDITFSIEGNKYKLTNDEKQFILQEIKIASDKSKYKGEEVLSSAKYFRSIPDAFAYIARTHVLSSDSVISSLADLERVHEAVRRSSGDIMRSLSCEIAEDLTNG